MTESPELLKLKSKLVHASMNEKDEGENEEKFRSLYSYLNYLETELWKHKDGHLPKLGGSSLKKLLDVAGVGDDYEVSKKIIYAKDGMSATLNQ